MIIYRLQIGIIHFYSGKPSWKPQYIKPLCNCICLEWWRFYVNWLSDDCLPRPYKTGTVELPDDEFHPDGRGK